jgi:hypothetical protein
MDYKVIGVFLLGMVVRLGIPVGITILLMRWLARLDARWQDEARHDARILAAGTRARNTGCWDVKHCTPEQKEKCLAYARKETPCWQVYRRENGALRESCLGCVVFKEAPIPITS